MIPISVTVLTKNSQKYIHSCLEALNAFDEVVLLDNGSIDHTLEIASSFSNVKIFKCDFAGFGPLKDLAASYAKNDWILNIDSDEVVTQELSKEIMQLDLDNETIYRIRRENYYNKKIIKCCGWYPDVVLRLYNKHMTSFDKRLVHESLSINAGINIIKLECSIRHFAFDNAAEIIGKMHLYTKLYAAENKGKKTSSPAMAVLHATFAFMKSYFLQLGFLYGYEGLLISISNANATFYKYISLYEENRNCLRL